MTTHTCKLKIDRYNKIYHCWRVGKLIILEQGLTPVLRSRVELYPAIQENIWKNQTHIKEIALLDTRRHILRLKAKVNFILKQHGHKSIY